MSEPFRELQVLADYTGGILAAGNWVRPAASTIGGELDSNERAEVVMLEIIPPLSALGAPEDVRVQLRLDGEVDEKMYFYGHRDLLTFAPKLAMMNGVVHALGKPLYNTQFGTLQGAVDGRCPKYNRTLSFDCYTAGGTTVAASWRVKAWGVRYTASSMAALFSGVQVGGTDFLPDKATQRRVTISKGMLPVTLETWDQLPGGLKQQVPKISNYIRVAANAAATTPNLPYEFRFDTGNVAAEEEDLRWEYAIYNRVLWLQGLGIRTTPASNLAQLFVDVGGDERPKNRWACTEFNNPKIFGHLGAYLGLGLHQAIPLLDDQILVAGENVGIKAVDNGVACGANSLFVAVSGVHFDLT